MVIGGITDFVVDTVVKKAIPKLVAMFIPGAGFISAIISIYDTVMVFVQQDREDHPGRHRLRRLHRRHRRRQRSPRRPSGWKAILAGLLSLAISFLAGFAGLGKVADKIMGVINKVRAPIDKALDWLVTWIVTMAKKLFAKAFGTEEGAVAGLLEWWKGKKTFSAKDGNHSLYMQGTGVSATLIVATTPRPLHDLLWDIKNQATTSPDAGVRSAYARAGLAVREYDRLKRLIETTTPPRQPADVAALNNVLEDLSQNLLPVLLLARSTGGRTGRGARRQGAVASRGGRPGQAHRRELGSRSHGNRPRPIQRPVHQGSTAHGASGRRRAGEVPRGEPARKEPLRIPTTKYGSAFTAYVDDPRDMYMGPTPDKHSDIAKLVKGRMAGEGKYDLATDSVRDAKGNWVPVSACDMSHVIDAVLWWNTQGRMTGPQSGAVRAFMRNPLNYELEPSGPNQLRGAQLAARGVKYRTPLV